MSRFTTPAPPAGTRTPAPSVGFSPRSEPRTLLAVYALTIFTSAFLLFLVQPMFSKMALPLLGGAPSVWNTCMLFFQTALLGGYLYAHLITRWLRLPAQVIVHVVVLTAALSTLPIAVGEAWRTPSSNYPTLWLLALLTVSLGLPFFVLSASGPLFQRWFSLTRHPDAHNPYFLYAASNLGSMLALLSYPVLIEPRLRLGEQTRLWAAGFAGLLILAAASGALLWRSRASALAGPTAVPDAAEKRDAQTGWLQPITARRRARWVLLAFAGSSLLLGVTTYVTTDIAAVPLLWVVPLALYLLTFVLVFARRQLVPHWLALRVQPFLVIPLVVVMFWGGKVGLAGSDILLHLGAFFVTALVCHGELARDRPPVTHLTEFYLLLSLGGALGGAFNTLVAPHIFDSVAEYPLVLVLACLLRAGPEAGPGLSRIRADLAAALSLGVLAALVVALQVRGMFPEGQMAMAGASIAVAVVSLSFAERPWRFGLGLGAVLLAGSGLRPAMADVLFTDRTFFGTHRVVVEAGSINALYHGTTLHGMQDRSDARRLEITTYYHPSGPLGQLFAALRQRGGELRVGIVGLGAGATTCYGLAGERWTYFEIDPVVERIARDPRLFTFLSECPPSVDVVIGDARLTLAHQPDGAFDVLIVDAFSSDAIPIHLLTREAVEMYLDKLAPGGVVAMHVSNRYLRLEPVLARLRQALGIDGLYAEHEVPPIPGRPVLASGSSWAVFAREADSLDPIRAGTRWQVPTLEPRVGVWTDDFANIIRVFRWR